MKLPSPYRSYPPGWQTFDQFVHVPGPAYMGFVGTVAQLNRFAARYRAAKCFTEVRFDELVHATADGYTALVHLLLTYSAFEHLLRCIGLELRSSSSLLSAGERDKALARIRSLNGSDDFFRALRQHLEPRYQRHIDTYRSEAPCNPLYLAAAVRHAFAHGHLTASPQGVPTETVGTVCRYLCRMLVWVMDREFRTRIEAFEADLEVPP